MAAGAERTVPARSGASATTVPTPFAAMRLAMDYHLADIASEREGTLLRPRVQPADLLSPSVAVRNYAPEEIAAELEGNLCQLFSGMASLVARGAGEAEPVGGRAALHAAGRHIANWLHHGVVDEETVRATMQRVAAAMESHERLSPEHATVRAVEDLVFKAGGTVDAVLPFYRRQAKTDA